MLIVDDGSTDGTEQMVAAHAALDSRIRFFRRTDDPDGAPACRNLGVVRAKGEFLLFLDSDDLLAATCLERRLQAFTDNPARQIVIGRSQRFKDSPGDLDPPPLWHDSRYNLIRALCLDFPWSTSSPLWRKNVFAEMGLWDETLQAGQDADLTLRALIHGFHAYEAPEIDHFTRANYSGVGARHCTEQGRESSFCRVETARKLLQARAMLNPQISLILAGNYFWVAQNFSSAGNLGRAREVWRHARYWSLLPKPQYFVGAIFLFFQARQRFLSRAFAPLAAWLLPRGCLIWPFKPSTDQRRIHPGGEYRPVHCPQGACGCAVDGDFSLIRWLTYPIRRWRGSVKLKNEKAFPSSRCPVPPTATPPFGVPYFPALPVADSGVRSNCSVPHVAGLSSAEPGRSTTVASLSPAQ
jgi:hypothetical protein